ncbi:hypothetical protein F4212_02010 [Candidatus Poribacteria bacterium]|nr:hypothetical protein [Candidatus Poribacteria bacterium]
MDLLQNPFHILRATTTDDRHRIMDLAQEVSLLSTTQECQVACDILIHPKKRIAAEIAWMPGVITDKARRIVNLLEALPQNQSDIGKSISSTLLATALSYIPYIISNTAFDEVFELLLPGNDKLNPLAQANLMAARIFHLKYRKSEVVLQWILRLSDTFDQIHADDVLQILNNERRQSGFPEIHDIDTVETEIRNRRTYYKNVIAFTLKNLPPQQIPNILKRAVETAQCSDQKNTSLLIEDVIEDYEIAAQAALKNTVENYFETLDKEIRASVEQQTEKDHDPLESKIKIAKLIAALEQWHIYTYPINVIKKKQGKTHELSQDLAHRIRHLAIHLFSEYDKLDISKQILNAGQQVFSEIPNIADKITADLHTLNKIQEQAKTKQMMLF